MWKLTRIEERPAAILETAPTGASRQRLHDLRGAIRTLELAVELGAFEHLGPERSGALTRAIEILTVEAKILVDGYAADC